MTIKTRQRLFYFLALIFIVLGGSAILYSQGIRFDFHNFTFRKTGGIYISVTPADVRILLNERPIDTNGGIFNKSVFVSNLLPGQYAVRIQKNEYYPYRKQVVVESGRVTEVTNVILAPQTEIVSAQPVERTIEDAIIFHSNTNTYFFRDIASGALLNVNLLFNNLKERELGLPGIVPLTMTAPHPFDARKLIVSSEQALYIIDIQRLAINLIHEKKPTNLAAQGVEIIWAEYDKKNNVGAIYSYNLLLRTKHILSDAIYGITEKLTISPSSKYVVLQQAGGELSILKKQEGELVLLSQNALRVSFAPDSRHIAFFDEDQQDMIIYNILSSAETRFPLDSPVKDISWHRDSAHIFLRTENGAVYFLDIDSRAPIYAPRIAEDISAMEYALAENILFIRSEGELWRAIDFNF